MTWIPPRRYQESENFYQHIQGFETQVRVLELGGDKGVATEPLHSKMRDARLVCVDGWHCCFFGHDQRAVKVLYVNTRLDTPSHAAKSLMHSCGLVSDLRAVPLEALRRAA